MKRQLIVLVCAASVLCLGGCGNQNLKQSAKEWDPNSIWDGVPPEGGAMPDFFEGMPPHGGEFPSIMAGIWEGELPNVKWDIKLEPSGSIIRIIHPIVGPADVSQSVIEANRPDDGSYYIFVMEPFEARYDPKTQMVRVKIVVDYFIMKIPAGEIEGRMEDYFEGFVSEDGTRWDTQWYSFKWIKGVPPPDIKATKAYSEPLIFIKMDPSQPMVEQVLE